MAYASAHWRIRGRRPHAPAARAIGTWKLAYADFLTALAAFFLVMWLVKGMPQSGRADIADYFEGAGTASAMAPASLSGEPIDTPRHIAAALETSGLFLDHGAHLSLAVEADGIRIDVMDRSGAMLFASGASALTPEGEAVLGEVFGAMAAMAWPVTLEGHTDAFPMAGEAESNWSLSARRAEAARQVAVAHGVSEDRFEAIIGFGDQRPRLPREPHHPSNRRVSVILHVPAHSSIPVSS